jgi:hypothetical protein
VSGEAGISVRAVVIRGDGEVYDYVCVNLHVGIGSGSKGDHQRNYKMNNFPLASSPECDFYANYPHYLFHHDVIYLYTRN